MLELTSSWKSEYEEEEWNCCCVDDVEMALIWSSFYILAIPSSGHDDN